LATKLKLAAWIGPVSTRVGVVLQPTTRSAARLSVTKNEYFIAGFLLVVFVFGWMMV
jgi:hypothetical protein